jgi:hypothetical protein
MEISSALASGFQGFQRASDAVTEATLTIHQQTAQSSQQLAPDFVPEPTAGPSIEQGLVTLTNELINAEANMKTVKTADEMLGSVIDVRV